MKAALRGFRWRAAAALVWLAERIIPEPESKAVAAAWQNAAKEAARRPTDLVTVRDVE